MGLSQTVCQQTASARGQNITRKLLTKPPVTPERLPAANALPSTAVAAAAAAAVTASVSVVTQCCRVVERITPRHQLTAINQSMNVIVGCRG